MILAYERCFFSPQNLAILVKQFRDAEIFSRGDIGRSLDLGLSTAIAELVDLAFCNLFLSSIRLDYEAGFRLIVGLLEIVFVHFNFHIIGQRIVICGQGEKFLVGGVCKPSLVLDMIIPDRITPGIDGLVPLFDNHAHLV